MINFSFHAGVISII